MSGQNLRGRHRLQLVRVGDGSPVTLFELRFHDEARRDAVAPRAAGAGDRELILGGGRPDDADLGRDDRGAGRLHEPPTREVMVARERLPDQFIAVTVRFQHEQAVKLTPYLAGSLAGGKDLAARRCR